MKILTVTGYKGGVGKSTTAIHLATYFIRNRRSLTFSESQVASVKK